jgi:diguanylate cyclase (GGDEF)-like protein
MYGAIPVQSMPPAPLRPVLRMCAVLGALAIAFHVAHGQLGLGGRRLDSFTDDGLYDAIVAGAAASCLARAWLIRSERLAWLLFGVGLAFNAAGEVYYSLAFGDSGNPPIPSVADLLYLLYYPCAYAALVLLVRGRMKRVSASSLLDGAIAAATSAAVIAAIAFEDILKSASHGSVPALLTTLAYPVGDMMLLAIVFCAFGISGWRPGRVWLLLGLGLVLWALADTGYVYTNAHGTYTVGGVLDSLWLAAAWLMGAAPWQSQRAETRLAGRAPAPLVPSVFAVVATGVLIYGGFHHVGAVGLALAGVAVLLVIVRFVWTVQENSRLLSVFQRDAVTDSLTGLGNRRAMQAALEDLLPREPGSAQAVFVMFDLDGFKAYNDRFGHLAGDTMLAHLGNRLEAAIANAGTAYRPGGDEFCVIFERRFADADRHIGAALRALSVEGDGFAVVASHGRVVIPTEARTPSQVLRLADDRMYAEKGARLGSARQQSHGVLLGFMRERQPELHQHMCEVGRLAVVTGARLGMAPEHLEELRQAAELHDIGNAAVPDAILNKPAPLTDEEWIFMRRHTIVGERILDAAPALANVAKLVRASHERWDGGGYPDGLAGDDIPLGARILFVCDAFDAMTSDRPYSRARSPQDAIAELRRAAGSQFDPVVVKAFLEAWYDRITEPAYAARAVGAV